MSPLRPRPCLVLLLLLALGSTATALPAARSTPDDEIEAQRLVFLLQYIELDYPNAVADGEIISVPEYAEMLAMSDEVLDGWTVLRPLGASADVLLQLILLQQKIAERAPRGDVGGLAHQIVASLVADLSLPTLPEVPPDSERGRQLYAAGCAACHGSEGDGQGVAAAWLDPKPTSFRDERVALLSPQQIHGASRFGVDGTAMPSYLEAYNDQQLWDIAFYVLTFGGDRVPAAAAPRSPAAGDSGLQTALGLQEAFAEVAERVAPSVVGIGAYVRDPDAPSRVEDLSAWQAADALLYPGFRRVGSGSGFCVDAEGLILTCASIITGADGEVVDAVDVELPDGTHVLSEVVGLEPTVNLAVLRLPHGAGTPAVTPVSRGDPEGLRVGHWTLALGDPPGPERIFAVGTLSSTPARQCYQADLMATLLHSAMTVHPLGYGGPLVDIHGNVVGMSVPPPPGRGVEGQPTQLALPIDLAMNLGLALQVSESRRSPWLGIAVLELGAVRHTPGGHPDLPPTGVYIDDVFEPSPAAAADVRVGDSLVAIDGQRLFSVFDFQKWLYLSGIDREVELQLHRDGESFTRRVTIAERPARANR